MNIKLVTFLLSIVLAANLAAQELSAQDSLLLNSVNDLKQAINSWTENDLQNSRAQFERLLTKEKNGLNYLIHYYIGLADYNLHNLNQIKDDKEKKSKFLEDGIEHLEKCLELKEDFAEARGLLSSFLGQKISLNPLKAVYLGPKSGQMMSAALEIDPQNPRLFYLKGVGAYYTPAMFGGGTDNARNALKKAAEYFKTYKAPSVFYPDWGERETYTWLGIIAAESDSLELARSYYDKALAISPGYKWIVNVLKPELDKKVAQKD